MARVIQAFKGVPDGESYTRTFKPGDEVTGDLARVAVLEGWATEEKAATVPKNKAHAKAPRNKSGAASQPGRASRKKTSKKSAKRKST